MMVRRIVGKEHRWERLERGMTAVMVVAVVGSGSILFHEQLLRMVVTVGRYVAGLFGGV